MKPHWQGVFPAITTQMKKGGALYLDSTARHAEALIKSGVAGIIFLGSLGENQTLTAEEKRRLIQAMVKSEWPRAGAQRCRGEQHRRGLPIRAR